MFYTLLRRFSIVNNYTPLSWYGSKITFSENKIVSCLESQSVLIFLCISEMGDWFVKILIRFQFEMYDILK